MLRTVVLIVCVLFVRQAVFAGTFVYVSVAGEKHIAVYSQNVSTGELTHRHNVATPGEPGALTTDPKRKFLFASMRSTGDLTSFRINEKTGNLQSLSRVPAGADPAFVSTDRTGRYLLSAYYQAGKVEVHKIEHDGRLSQKPLCSIKTDEKAHAILTDSSNQFAFVPHTGPNAIYQFHFDADTGKLIPNEVPILNTGDNTGPRHLAFHPKLDVVYFDNEQGSSVTAYRFDRKTGRLSPFQTMSTLPEGFDKPNSCARLEMSPDGRFVVAANRGHDSLAVFAVEESTGRLKTMGQIPTEATPRSFNISSNGRFVYAAGQSSGRLAAFRMDGQTGRLTRFATYDVGDRPWWVLMVEVSNES